MIVVGSHIAWNGRSGVVLALGWSLATEQQIATVDFGLREVLRLPADELSEEACQD